MRHDMEKRKGCEVDDKFQCLGSRKFFFSLFSPFSSSPSCPLGSDVVLFEKKEREEARKGMENFIAVLFFFC